MILNLRPTDLGLLDCIIEECDGRFSAEQQEEILGIVEVTLSTSSGLNGINGETEEVHGRLNTTNGPGK